MTFHLAQFNMAPALAPLDSPQMADFMAGIERVNALAEQCEGFVWRLQTDDGDATSLRPFGDDVLINMSVWTSIESLRAFAFKTEHAEFLRRRKEWFGRFDVGQVLWWIPAGTLPTFDDVRERLALLADRGPTRDAFVFKHPFDPPDLVRRQG